MLLDRNIKVFVDAGTKDCAEAMLLVKRGQVRAATGKAYA